MFSKYIVPALCATNILNGVEASSRHRHMHKKDVQYAATEVEILTHYVTVTVVEGEETAAPIAQPTVAAAAAYHSPKPHTTLATSLKVPASDRIASASKEAATQVVAPVAPSTPVVAPVVVPTPIPSPVVVATPSQAPAAPTSAAAAATSAKAPSSSGKGKRGLAYNDANLVSTIISIASGKFTWAYNWGFDDTALGSKISYIPMLWGPNHYNSKWDTTAQAAVKAGTEALLSFNECDNAGQANLSPSVAAQYHQQYFTPYAGQIRISTPAITSSTSPNQGVDWLKQFFSACGSNCVYDFCNVHWYGPGGEAGAVEFLNHLDTAHKACGKPLWVTEFAATDGDADAFLKYALNQLDNNATLSYVEKYSYFYLATGSLFSSNTALSTIGQTYATS